MIPPAMRLDPHPTLMKHRLRGGKSRVAGEDAPNAPRPFANTVTCLPRRSGIRSSLLASAIASL
jgi:hypothetical protein